MTELIFAHIHAWHLQQRYEHKRAPAASPVERAHRIYVDFRDPEDEEMEPEHARWRAAFQALTPVQRVQQVKAYLVLPSEKLSELTRTVRDGAPVLISLMDIPATA